MDLGIHLTVLLRCTMTLFNGDTAEMVAGSHVVPDDCWSVIVLYGDHANLLKPTLTQILHELSAVHARQFDQLLS